MEWDDYVSRPDDTVWDVVVVGTGAGGGPAGLNLARMGQKVLFLERGQLAPNPYSIGRLSTGWWPEEMRRIGKMVGGPLSNNLPVGCGLGGSTALASLTMDRFRPIDFIPRSVAPPSAAALVPGSWPIAYEELEPHYREAESLFRLRGTQDPLSPMTAPLIAPLPPSEEEIAIHGTLARCGLHPYRMHTASERVDGCTLCLARRCKSECRNDTGRVCVLPALQTYGARITPECHVTSLGTRGRTVTHAICRYKDEYVHVRARAFVLALHALLTPALLLRSANSDFPHGLGNRSGLVGRNLMLHATDVIEVQFKNVSPSARPHLNHGVSVNDFYSSQSIKMGNIHAHPFALEHGDKSSIRAVFATIVEDFPYPQNRIIQSDTSEYEVQWEYDYPKELRDRCDNLIRFFSDALRPIKVEHLNPPPHGNLNVSHACGTCRFGDDPRTSVLDRNNRVHELDNLYVVDGSFFPSSGGMNPSLTIAANSLRATSAMMSS